MNNNQTVRRAYLKPEAVVITTECRMRFLEVSFQGGHTGVQPGGDLGDSGAGHSGGESGGGTGDARPGLFDLGAWGE